MWDPYAEFQSTILPNGLTIHAAHWPGRPWEVMGFLIHSGAEHDPIGLEGLSHFVEHLVSGNAPIPKKDIKTFFENCGGRVDLGRTSYPGTKYSFFVPTDKKILKEALSIFGQMLLSAQMEKFIERERQVIIGEFHRPYPLKFRFDLDVRKNKALYTGYWLERFVRPLGAPESIERITPDALQSHYDQHYAPINMSIVGVGGMTLSELADLLSESPFAINKKGARTPVPNPTTDATPPLENRYVFEMSKQVITPFEVGAYLSVAKIPGNVSARAIKIMSDMFDKVLNEEIRERRAWTYSIGNLRFNYRHFNEFSINCNALAIKALDEIEEVIEICLASIGDRNDLFEQVKQSTLAGNFMIDLTAGYICDDAVNDLANDQEITSIADYRRDIEQVTISDVRNLLHWLRPERRWTLITQP